MLSSSQQQTEKERIEAREQAARESQELRNQRDAARLKAERVKLEAARTLQEQGQETQALRHDDQARVAEAWNRAKGCADEQFKEAAFTIRAASEEN
eukprot:3226117-Pyramimonas_sp.AAC.1